MGVKTDNINPITLVIAKDDKMRKECSDILDRNGVGNTWLAYSQHEVARLFNLFTNINGVLYKDYWEHPEIIAIIAEVYYGLKKISQERADAFIIAVNKSYKGRCVRLCITSASDLFGDLRYIGDIEMSSQLGWDDDTIKVIQE